MKKIYDFTLFLEATKESTPKNEIEKEVKKIISEMFAVGKNIKFSGDKEPSFVEFEIDVNDYKLSYNEDLFMEYTDNVLKKRMYQVSLKFDSKSKEGVGEKVIYNIKFKINLNSISNIKFEKKEVMIAWNFDKKPIKVIKFIKKSDCDYEWNSSKNVLSIKKCDSHNLDSAQLKSLIKEEGGEKE